MPARLFFYMDTQIPRIQASNDVRKLSVVTCSMGGDHVDEVYKTLVAEQGEVYVMARTAYVEAESDALARLKELM